jgi:hypothetical protein
VRTLEMLNSPEVVAAVARRLRCGWCYKNPVGFRVTAEPAEGTESVTQQPPLEWAICTACYEALLELMLERAGQ